MIELRYKRMHVYRVSIAHARSSKRTRIYICGSEQGGGGGGGRVYEIKTLRSNLAPEEGGGAFIRGGRIIEQVRYWCVQHQIATIVFDHCSTVCGTTSHVSMANLLAYISLSHTCIITFFHSPPPI